MGVFFLWGFNRLSPCSSPHLALRACGADAFRWRGLGLRCLRFFALLPRAVCLLRVVARRRAFRASCAWSPAPLPLSLPVVALAFPGPSIPGFPLLRSFVRFGLWGAFAPLFGVAPLGLARGLLGPISYADGPHHAISGIARSFPPRRFLRCEC